MCAAKLACASCSSGAESASARLTRPPAEAATRQPGTGPPRRRRRHHPTAYAPARISSGATTSGRVLHGPEASVVSDQTSPGEAGPNADGAPWATVLLSGGEDRHPDEEGHRAGQERRERDLLDDAHAT